MRLCPWSLVLASSVPVLGLERFCPRKGCPWPWPWPRIFFVSLALALASSLVSSTPPLVNGITSELHYNYKTLKQVEKFKYLCFTVTLNDRRQHEELDTRIGKASALMQFLHYFVVMNREWSKKAKLSIFKTVICPHSQLWL